MNVSILEQFHILHINDIGVGKENKEKPTIRDETLECSHVSRQREDPPPLLRNTCPEFSRKRT